MATQELTFKINMDPAVATAEFKRFTSQVVAGTNEVTNVTRQQSQAVIALQRQRSAALIADWKKEERESQRTEQQKLRDFQRSINEITRAEQRRVAETIRAANQRLKEEQRAAREVARINADTARQAEQQERIRERAARQLADVQIREAKRAAKELEASLKSQGGVSSGGSGFSGAAGLFGIAGRIPGLSGLTSEISSFTSATQSAGVAQSSLAGPIGLVTLAVGAQVTAVISLHREIFQLAQRTAKFEGDLFDMSQQVGVSVETLSTLQILAATTGGDIGTVSASLAIFQKNLEASHDPTSKQSKLLAELGVTSEDTEEALAQTLTGLFKLGEGSRQTAAVLELFGRSGRFVNAILKESGGDLEKARAKFAELGIVVGTDAARAADQFNDNLTLLEFQIRGLTALIGNEVIPTTTGALEGIRKVLKDNKDAVEALGVAVKATAGILSIPFFSALSSVDALIKTHKGEIALLKDAYEALAAAMQLVSNNVPEIPSTLIPPVDLSGEKSGITLLRELQQLFKQSGGAGFDSKIFKEPVELPEGLFKKEASSVDPAAALLKQLQSELRSLNNLTKEQEIAIRLLDEQYKSLAPTLREQITLVARAIDMRQAAIEGARLEKQLAQDQKQQIDAARESLTSFMRQQAEALRQLRFGDKTAVQEAEDFIALFPKWTGAMKETQTFSDAFWLRFNAHIIDSARRMKEMIALMRETANLVPGPNEGRKVPEPRPINAGIPPPETISAQIDAAIKAQGAFAGLGVAISDVIGLGQGGAIAFADALSGAFSQVAQAVGQAVHAFVLFGTAQGGFRKFAAEVIASIAQMAVVQAIWEGAQGLAMLALTWFTGNPKYAASAGAHFAAAAAYGIVAGVAIPLGRAVAGDTFKQPPSGAGSGGSGGSEGPQQLNPLTFNRNQPQPQRVVLEIRAKGEEMKIFSVKAVKENYTTGGELREMIHNDGGV